MHATCAAALVALTALAVAQSAEVARSPGRVTASFPHRIWAACDFEGRTPDYGWFGPAETNNFPKYPGNATALGVGARPYQNFSGVMTGINPVPGPRMGKENHLFVRYFLRGATNATFQHFSLTSEDNQHINVSGLTEGKWTDLDLNFTRDSRRNDGTRDTIRAGNKVDDLFFFVTPETGQVAALFVDEVVLFDAGVLGGAK